MNPKAVTRSKQEKEIDTYAFRYKRHEGSLTIVNGVVENISLSIECEQKTETSGREVLRATIDDLPLSEAKSLYLVLRSMLKITGDLEELDECIL